MKRISLLVLAAALLGVSCERQDFEETRTLHEHHQGQGDDHGHGHDETKGHDKKHDHKEGH
jgi:hypothetical protein